MTSPAVQYGSLREKIAAEKQARLARYAGFATLYGDAQNAGTAAAGAMVPVPMCVACHVNPLDDNSRITKSWIVEDGVCGFAWVKVTPGTSSFAKWLVKQGLARKDYGGGVAINIGQYNQSMQKKEAHASAMAKVFQAAGITAYSQSRMD